MRSLIRKIHAFTFHNTKAGVFLNDSCDTQEELHMGQDIEWKSFFADDKRYADIINGIAFQGQ